MNNQPIICFTGKASMLKQNVILDFIDYALSQGKQVFFTKQAKSLDMDTQGKDSYELFESGLDYVTLVTGRHRYLKSKHNFISQLTLPVGVDWIIQENELLPATIYLQIDQQGGVSPVENHTGEPHFKANEIEQLYHWVVQRL